MTREEAIAWLECIEFEVAPKTQKALIRAISDMNKLKTVQELLTKMCDEYDSVFDKTLAECLSILKE